MNHLLNDWVIKHAFSEHNPLGDFKALKGLDAKRGIEERAWSCDEQPVVVLPVSTSEDLVFPRLKLKKKKKVK